MKVAGRSAGQDQDQHISEVEADQQDADHDLLMLAIRTGREHAPEPAETDVGMPAGPS